MFLVRFVVVLFKLEKLYLIAKEFSFWFSFPKSWAKVENLPRYLTELKEMAEHHIKANNLHNSLMQTWNDMFLQQSGEQLLKEYNDISAKWFLAKITGINGFAKKFK